MTKKKWKFEDILDQTGKTVIVTGANSGTGFETAKALARKSAHVIMACRNMDKAKAAKEEILAEFPEVSLEIIQLDLADLKSIKKFALLFKKNHHSIDILCNNAGVMMVPKGKTVDGFETNLGINHLGHFALTGLLIDVLLKTPNSRIISVSSFVHPYANMNFKNLQWEKKYNKTFAYTRSKLANLLFAYELQRKLDEVSKQTISVVAHPGWSKTGLQRNTAFYRFLNPFMGQSQSKGALPLLYASTVADVNGGDYIGPPGPIGMRGYPKKVQSSKKSHSLDSAKKLWQVSEELTSVKFRFD